MGSLEGWWLPRESRGMRRTLCNQSPWTNTASWLVYCHIFKVTKPAEVPVDLFKVIKPAEVPVDLHSSLLDKDMLITPVHPKPSDPMKCETAIWHHTLNISDHKGLLGTWMYFRHTCPIYLNICSAIVVGAITQAVYWISWMSFSDLFRCYICISIYLEARVRKIMQFFGFYLKILNIILNWILNIILNGIIQIWVCPFMRILYMPKKW